MRSHKPYHRMNDNYVKILWTSFFKLAGIKDEDYKKVPIQNDPEHAHVKAILFVYSLESFLFEIINKSSREKDTTVIKTLGPFAVAISNIIENLETKRLDKMEGPFICYRGLSLNYETIEKWKSKKVLYLDGYNSTSLRRDVSLNFAIDSETEDLDQVILEIHMKNETGKHFVCMNRQEYTCYLSEQEVLLQAGLFGKITNVRQEEYEYKGKLH
jgi:hypothetical protein